MAEIVDRNLQVNKNVDETGARFYSVREDPFDVYGLYNYRTEKTFKRLPDELSDLSWGIKNLYRNTAGARVRFSTDSDYIIIRAKMSQISKMPHMPLISSAGFDLYTDCKESGISWFTDIFRPDIDMTDGYESKIFVRGKGIRYYTINFPSYSSVDDLEIGLKEGSFVGGGLKYRDILPVLYYGCSVTQGACSSRPGNAYQNIVSRRTNTDFINLGFSGWARGETELAKYMSTIKMSAFVSDYDHNAPDVEHLKNTHKNMYEIIREKNPDVPYIIMSKPDFFRLVGEDIGTNAERRDVIYETYRYALKNGDKNVYFLDGSSMFISGEEDMCTVDNAHPNDYGFYLMANAVEGTLHRIWVNKSISGK